jgi:hypothetical protein
MCVYVQPCRCPLSSQVPQSSQPGQAATPQIPSQRFQDTWPKAPTKTQKYITQYEKTRRWAGKNKVIIVMVILVVEVRQCGNRLISIINDADSNAKELSDPLDRFKTTRDAAQRILGHIYDDLLAHKRLREYEADFLLYSVISKAADEMTPIYSAYGHRLRQLQDCLDTGELRHIDKYVDEVSRVRLELKELRQWIGQMKEIIGHRSRIIRMQRGLMDPMRHGISAWVRTARAKICSSSCAKPVIASIKPVSEWLCLTTWQSRLQLAMNARRARMALCLPSQ